MKFSASLASLFLVILFFPPFLAVGQNCRPKWFPESESFVCVCSAEFCDEPELLGELNEGKVVLFVSEKKKLRLARSEITFGRIQQDEVPTEEAPSLLVNASITYQELLGFGGAFSDSAGLNLNALSWSTRERLLRAYFDPVRGIGYTLGRVPIASTDFSTREYSYLEKERDFQLESFALAPEDLEAKIPHIKAAHEYANGELRLFAVPWAAPAWMKSNGRMAGEGQLKGDLEGPYYRTYAHYLKRFFDEYAALGIHFWALTLQNQPESGLEKDFPFQAMFMSNHTQREFAARLLVPLLKESSYTANLKLLAFDDVREHLLSSTNEFFKCHPEEVSHAGADLIDGIGIHWYMLDGHEAQSEFHEQFPEKLILSTEACAGFLPEDQGPNLGNWTRGMMYGNDIIQNLRNWANGWVDWNLCLNIEGGPNWVHNHVDAPILVNSDKDEFYKQPMFYFLAHFSRFVPPGSVRIESTQQGPILPIEHVAFVTPSGERVLVLISGPSDAQTPIDLALKDARWPDKEAKVILGPDSVLTAIWA